jgi:hypothetical protein
MNVLHLIVDVAGVWVLYLGFCVAVLYGLGRWFLWLGTRSGKVRVLSVEEIKLDRRMATYRQRNRWRIDPERYDLDQWEHWRAVNLLIHEVTGYVERGQTVPEDA